MGILKGLSVGLNGNLWESRNCNNVGPLYHFRFSDFSKIFSPVQPEIGIKKNLMVI